MSISKQAWYGHLPYKPNLHLLPAITLYVTTPSCVSTSSSSLLWADDSNAHDSRKQLFCHSSHPLGYISKSISERSFNIDPAPASTKSPLQVFTSACCLLYWTCYSQYSRLCSRKYCSWRSRHCPQVHSQFHRNILLPSSLYH